MEKIIKCKSCNKTFELTGGGTGREFTRIVGCFHCNEPVEFKWPMDGEYNAGATDGGTDEPKTAPHRHGWNTRETGRNKK